MTETSTPVYAWNDLSAPKVALLEKDTTLTILKDEADRAAAAEISVNESTGEE